MKHPSFGSKVYWDPDGGTSWSAIGQVTDISGPSVTRGDVDTTDHDDAVGGGGPGSGWRTFAQGIPDGGDLTFGIIFDPINKTSQNQTSGTGILSDFESTGALAAWKIELHTQSGTLEWAMDGYVNGATFETPLEGTHTGEITVKISGKPVLTAS